MLGIIVILYDVREFYTVDFSYFKVGHLPDSGLPRDSADIGKLLMSLKMYLVFEPKRSGA